MGVSYGDDRGTLGYSCRRTTLRRCNECGYTAEVRYNSHKRWQNGKAIYCGYMRVVYEEE